MDRATSTSTAADAAVPAVRFDDGHGQRHLRVDELSPDLKRRSISGGAMMIVSHALQLMVGVAGTAVLARLLRPQDFGYLAMVATLTSFVATFRDMGLSNAAVYRQELTHHQVSRLFWVNCVTSFVVAGLVAALAPALAWFYVEPKLVLITIVVAAGVLVSSLSMLHVGLLRRQMRFGAVATLELGALTAGVLVGIALALAGAGYWALVFQQLAVYIWQAASAWVLCRWRPARPARSASLSDPAVRSMLRYGRNTAAARVISYLGRSMDAILVGRFSGASVLGLYQKAYQWSVLPFWQINTPMLAVVVSSFSRLQHDSAQYRSYARVALLGLFSSTLPAMVLLFAEAEAVILLLLGQQWAAAVPIFRILTVGAYFASFALVTRWFYLAEGRTGRELRWALVSSALTILAVAVGSRWGALGVAGGCSAAAVVLAVPGVCYCLRGSPVRPRDFWGAAWRPAVASTLAGAVLWPLRSLIPAAPHIWTQLCISGAIYILAYLVCWIGLPGGRAKAADLVRQLRAAPRPWTSAS